MCQRPAFRRRSWTRHDDLEIPFALEQTAAGASGPAPHSRRLGFGFGLDRGRDRLRLVLKHAAGAAIGAASLVWFGPPGTDLAAHVYQRAVFLHHGFVVWNNYWYSGRYSYVTYSVLYYPLAGFVGIRLLAVTSVAIAAAAFSVLIDQEWPRAGPWPARTFTAAAAASVLSGAFPYALGFALALGALVALRSGRTRVGALLIPVTFAASPLASALMAVVLGAVVLSGRRAAIVPTTALAATVLGGILLWRVFPAGGRYPFSLVELIAALVFCTLGLIFTWRIPTARLLHCIFAVYAIACLASFLVPSGVGENIARLRFIAVPLAVLTFALRHWRPLAPAAVAIGLAVSWNVSPLAASFVHARGDPSAKAAYWQPTVRFLTHSLPPSYRVEAVDTVGHWGAAYLARAGIPIVRGWFRQDDFPQNDVLYGTFGSRGYLTWLRRTGVRFVVLTDAPADYSSRGEARLLRSGHSGLRPVWRRRHVVIFAVPEPTAIITGPAPARVVRLRQTNVVLDVQHAGRYRLAIRYTPYWSSTTACVRRASDGMTEVIAPTGGRIRLQFTMSADRILSVAAGEEQPCPS